MRDPYDVLGIPPSSSDEDVKKAYRSVALRTHPDRNPGDAGAEARFREATEAYETLMNKRTASTQHHGVADGSFRDPLKDLFDSFFGPFSPNARQAARQTARRSRMDPEPEPVGDDVATAVTISFVESMLGCKRTVSSGSAASTCDPCAGSGFVYSAKPSPCATCSGSGSIPEFSGMRTRTCPSCRGKRHMPLPPCPSCGGSGRDKSKAVVIVVPAGVQDGMTMKVRGHGMYGNPPGDLYVTVRVEPSADMSRVEFDLHMSKSVPIDVMVRGGKLNFKTPFEDVVELQVHPGTESGTKRTIRGAGFPNPAGGARGDIVVRLDMSLPKSMSPRQTELLNQFLRELDATGGVTVDPSDV